jgi:prephenate dehydratase
MKKVAIQGIAGSFHEIAARKFFGEEVNIIPCLTFKDIFEQVTPQNDNFGIIAIENTIAGSLLQNHHLISNSDLQIIGEYKLRIEHSLVALPNQKLEDITEVHSHPIALMQCEEFLSQHKSLKAVESEDTAFSAREIAEKQLKGQAAICGRLAAEIYNLEILAEGIETNKHNFTRFLVVTNQKNANKWNIANETNKASLMLTVPHEEGSLSKILTIFSFYHINLSKIQSLPIIGKEWEYRFYITLEYDDYERYQQALSAVKPFANEFKNLGEYKAFTI